MNSVLLIGNQSFTTAVVTQVRSLDSLTIAIASNAREALPILSKAAPDVMLIQASSLIEGSISNTFSLERSSTYFVVIEDSISDGTELGLSTYYTSEVHLERTAFALEGGADAYIWLMPYEWFPVGQRTSQIANELPAPISGQEAQRDQNYREQGHLKVRTQAAQPLALHSSQRRLIQAHIQIGLNRAQRYRDLSRINDWLSAVALVDALTQLNNRRSFDLELPRKVKVARSKNTPLSLMVIDIDSFKAVNDRHGHLVGDDVLKMLAKRLLTNMRFYDTPFRYGGEEFVVTLSNTDITEGMAIAQRLRQSIEQTPFEISSRISAAGKLPLTISIGLTELRAEDDEHGRSCLHRADQHLLQAKAKGRNRVISDKTAEQ